MRIKKVIFSKSNTGFYFDDQRAIKKDAKLDGFQYTGTPVTFGFSEVRQPGEAISIQLILENGMIAKGDCAAVQYSGAGGRDPLFLADLHLETLNDIIKPLLLKIELDEFRKNAKYFDSLTINQNKIHTALRYGITQALLHAVSLVKGISMAEVIREEYGINGPYQYIPIFSQSGDDRFNNADKMIIKEADILPHALFNSVEKLGKNGEVCYDYLVWLKNRIDTFKPQYKPIIQIDVYGTIGVAFNLDIDKMTDYMIKLEQAVAPLQLQIEGPVDTDNKEETMNYLKEIRIALEKKGSNVKIVADEWCNTLEDIKYFADNKAGHILQIKTPDLGGINNTIEAALYCNAKGIGSYIGGTCNETNISAEITTHIAVATNALQILAKPGMGVDEGLMIMKNEMNRLLAYLNGK